MNRQIEATLAEQSLADGVDNRKVQRTLILHEFNSALINRPVPGYRQIASVLPATAPLFRSMLARFALRVDIRQ